MEYDNDNQIKHYKVHLNFIVMRQSKNDGSGKMKRLKTLNNLKSSYC